MAEGITIVRASVDDAATITAQRRAMFFDMGHCDGAVLDPMAAAFAPWVAAKLASGEYLAWFAVDADGTIVGGIGLWLMDWLPHLIAPGKRRGNIVNVYTRRDFRRQGIARSLVTAALDWCRANSVRYVILHASREGRALYESMSFQPTNEMRILL